MDDVHDSYESEVTHASGIRMAHLLKGGIALLLLYISVSVGREPQICPPGAASCGVTPLWNGMLVVTGVLLAGFAAASLIYSLSLQPSWERLAHRVGSYVPPAVVLSLCALGILVATAPYR